MWDLRSMACISGFLRLETCIAIERIKEQLHGNLQLKAEEAFQLGARGEYVEYIQKVNLKPADAKCPHIAHKELAGTSIQSAQKQVHLLLASDDDAMVKQLFHPGR